MHLFQLFSVAAVTASVAFAFPVDIPPVAISELKPFSDAQLSPNIRSEDHILARSTPEDVSVDNSGHDPIRSNALAVRQQPSRRKNLFTITIQGGSVVFNGAINWAMEAFLDTSNHVTTFHMNPLANTDRGATASMTSYEFGKNWFGTTINRVSTRMSFTYQTNSGVIYNFLANVVYGIDSRLNLILEDVDLFEIYQATQKLPGKLATKLSLGSFEDDYKDL